ncbi:hypothetical protein GCM10009613_32380 [Pseudonocardia kongjuensis]|uniref:Uncharacterized protein n=1 Tax=Pseudonocardia kongjuensis TaxID=102227 RepID=A0ABP4IHL5_9PSEU
MSEPRDGLHIVAAPAAGWCEPDTGTCRIDPSDDGATDPDPTDRSAGPASDPSTS